MNLPINIYVLLHINSTFEGLKITMRQLYSHTDDYRPLLKEIKKSGETRLILVTLRVFTRKINNPILISC